MKILNYVLVALIAVVPIFWIENYTVTNPVWWTVVSAWIIGRLFGYLDGKREEGDE